MEPIGQKLRDAREGRGLSLQEARQELRIHGPYLEALEAEEFGQLPAPAYARAFLRQYAVYLGLDPEPLIAAYGQQTGNQPPSLNVGWTAAPQVQAGWGAKTWAVMLVLAAGVGLTGANEVRSYLAGKEAAGHGMAAGHPAAKHAPGRGSLVLPAKALAAGAPSRMAGPAPSAAGEPAALPAKRLSSTTRAPAGPASREAVAKVASPVARPAGAQAASSRGGTVPAYGATVAPETGGTIPAVGTEAAAAGVQLGVTARERCWTRIRADGKTLFVGVLGPGEARAWRAARSLEATLGNAGGVLLSLNGQDLGAAGKPGRVFRKVFRAAGVQEPRREFTAEAQRPPSRAPALIPFIPLAPALGR